MEQLTLSFDQGISKRHRSLLSLVSARIYHFGLDNVARDVDLAPSNLSTALGGGNRKFGIDHLERYIEKYKDPEPIFYLIDKFLTEKNPISKTQLLMKCSEMMVEMQAMLREIKE